MKRLLIFSFFIQLFYILPLAAAERVIVIGVPIEWTKELTIVKELLTETYKEAGYQTIFKDFPLARGINLVANGDIDGEIARADLAAKKYNLILVRPAFLIRHENVYYLKSKFPTRPSPEIIRSSSIAYMRGDVSAETYFEITGNKNIFAVNNEEQMINLLYKNRVDFILRIRPIRSHEVELGSFSLFENGMYHVLAEKNKELAAIIGPILKKNMKKKKYLKISEEIRKLLINN